MASLYILNLTKGVQNLKKSMRNKIPGAIYHQAVREFKQWVRWMEERDKLSPKLKFLCENTFTDDGVNLDCMDELMASQANLERYTNALKGIENSPWRIGRIKSKKGRSVQGLLYQSKAHHKAYFFPKI